MATMLAWVASLALFLAPIGHELGHLLEAEHGHATSTSTEVGHREAGSGTAAHGECEGWTVTAERHQQHSDWQFEAVDSLLHHPHGVCPGPVSGSDSVSIPLLGNGPAIVGSSGVGTFRTPYRQGLAKPPSRGPPAVVGT